MKRALAIVLPVLAAGAGFAAGVLWQRGQHEGRSEDIVRAEITLLQRHKGIPRCEELTAAAGQTRSGDAVVHWRKVPGQERLQRVVVGSDLNVAYEEIDVECGPPKK